MIGVPGLFARRVLRRRPDDIRSDERWMEVFLSPSRAPWDYWPIDGPWRLVRCDVLGGRVYAMETYDNVAEALCDFAHLHLPRGGEMCGLIDERDQMILGWTDTHHTETEPDCDELYRYEWLGCAGAFEVLAVCRSDDEGWAVKVAHWERLAAAWPEGRER